jgi:RNA polymerase sigma-70 factor, ECF subfamily
MIPIPIPEQEFVNEIKKHEAQLKSFIFRLTASREDTEDIVQDALLRAYQKRDSFRGESTFKTWLFTIASNTAKNHLRAKRRWPEDAQDQCRQSCKTKKENADALQYVNKTAEFGRYEIIEHIDFCFTCIMKTLPLEQHVALMLADIYSFKVKEISEILDMTEGVIKHLLVDARKTMQTVFEKRCALINKEGICHQCSELNGFHNNKAETQRLIAELDIVKAANDPQKKDLFQIRTNLVRGIDPLMAAGTDLHTFLFKLTQKTIGDV